MEEEGGGEHSRTHPDASNEGQQEAVKEGEGILFVRVHCQLSFLVALQYTSVQQLEQALGKQLERESREGFTQANITMG